MLHAGSLSIPWGLLDPLFQLGYNILKGIAIILWALDRLLLAIGYFIAKFTEILIDKVFSPGLDRLGDNLRVNLLPVIFTVAVLLLGITYVLAAFWMKGVNLVDWKKAVAWLLGCLLFYTAAPDLFQQGEVLRRNLGGLMYETILDTTAQNCNAVQGNSIRLPTLSELLPAGVTWGTDDSGIGPLCNVFQGDLKYDKAIDGLDVAFSYVFAVKTDLNSDLPVGLSNRYFVGYDSGFFADNNWEDIFDREIKGLHRLFMDIWIIIFGIVEQFVFFVLTVIAGTMFFTLAFALLLSFFNHTEYIARSIIKAWFSVLMISLFASFIQAVGVFILLVGSTSFNPLITQAATVMGLFLVFLSAKTAIESAVQMLSSLPMMGQGLAMTMNAGSSTLALGAALASPGLSAARAAAGGGRAGAMGGGGGMGGGRAGYGGGGPLQGMNYLTGSSRNVGANRSVSPTEGSQSPGRAALPPPTAAFGARMQAQTAANNKSSQTASGRGLSPTAGQSVSSQTGSQSPGPTDTGTGPVTRPRRNAIGSASETQSHKPPTSPGAGRSQGINAKK
jgi:hypothetical protein